jgi:uncharacterized membrane protein (UPF0136 family)
LPEEEKYASLNEDCPSIFQKEKVVETFLFASPILVAVVGILIGYLCKPVILVFVTIPAALLALYALLLMDNRDIGGMLALIVGVQCFALVVPMWIARALKIAKRNGVTFWKTLKERTLDAVKKSDE